MPLTKAECGQIQAITEVGRAHKAGYGQIQVHNGG